MMDIFRKSEDVPPIVESAIARGARDVWLQEGIDNEEAARLADEAGIDFMMDRCMRKECRKLGS